MTDLTQILADHVASFPVSGVPATAAARLGLDLADTLAAAVGGMRATGVPETLDTLAAEAGLGVSRVIGDARRLPATFAAQANATAAHALDFDDTLDEATGRRIVAITADTGDDRSVTVLVERALSELGGIEILVNNAATPGGVGPAARIAEVASRTLLDDVNVKVAGYLRTAQALAPHLITSGWGRIINIGGLAARSSGHYIASVRNVAVSALTKNLADELGPLGITANAIHPGATRTEKTTPEQEQRFASSNSVRKLIDASDIAWLVAVLASPRSIAINGETIAAGGGMPKVINY